MASFVNERLMFLHSGDTVTIRGSNYLAVPTDSNLCANCALYGDAIRCYELNDSSVYGNACGSVILKSIS